MKRLLIILVSLLAYSLTYAQCDLPSPQAPTTSSAVSTASYSSGSLASLQRGMLGVSNSMVNRYFTVTKSYSSVNGSPYLTDSKVNATLVLNNDEVLNDVAIQYDVYAKEIVATDESGDDLLLDTRFYKEITFEKDGEEILLKKVNPKSPEVFYEVLYESGNVVFYKDHQVRLREAEDLGIVKREAQFSQHKNYYVKGEDDTLARVNLKKRDVFDHFPELEAVAFREYIKNSKIKLSKEKDYKKLFAAMDD